MNDFFAPLYEPWCSSALASSLKNDFGSMFISVLIVAGIGVTIYYYVINHPRFNHWWSWLIIVALCCVYNFFIVFSKGGLMLGIGNSIYSFLSAIIISLIIKWGSRNAKYSPFVKF